MSQPKPPAAATTTVPNLRNAVDALLSNPDAPGVLGRVRSLVEECPHSYATVLRTAAERTAEDRLAVIWLTEAARVQESLGNAGEAVALLASAWEREPHRAETRELLRGQISRLCARVGLQLEAAHESEAATISTPSAESAYERMARPPMQRMRGAAAPSPAPEPIRVERGSQAGSSGAAFESLQITESTLVSADDRPPEANPVHTSGRQEARPTAESPAGAKLQPAPTIVIRGADDPAQGTRARPSSNPPRK